MSDNEEQESGGALWIRIIFFIVYCCFIIAYATQTFELVQWLFPDDNNFMRGVTVFVCDGCATGYALAEMFYPFRLRRSKQLVFGMWIFSFVLSTIATVIQIYLQSIHRIPHTIDFGIILVAYGLIIVAFVAQITVLTIILRMEIGASQSKRVYLDDKPTKQKTTIQPVPLAQTAQMPPIPEKTVTITEKQLQDLIRSVKQDPQ